MAINAGTGAVGGNSQNIPDASVPRTRSTFPLEGHRMNTERYGEYTPIIAFESVKEDRLPVRLSHQLLSYTMKKPLMSNVDKIKDLFSVPMEAILPLNWEKFFDNPVRGDDVPNDVGPTIENFWGKVSTFMSTMLSSLRTILSNSSTTDETALTATLRFLILGEYFYSNGSLMATLGCHGAPYVQVQSGYTVESSWDKMFDWVVDDILQNLAGVTYVTQSPSASYNWVVGATPYERAYVPFDHIISLMRDDPTGYFSNVSNIGSSLRTELNSVFNSTSGVFGFAFNTSSTVPFNTQFLSAYQLCCAHYYTNDHIDFVYSAELYRQLINHYHPVGSFTRNGITYYYDALSANNISSFYNPNAAVAPLMLTTSTGTTVNDGYARSRLGLISAIFAFRRSLKYLDYFTGSRTSPLAVGSTNVPVSSNQVSVIDITRNIQRQRFLNSVNRVAHSFEGYLKAIFGGRMPAPDYHNPFHLANVKDTVFGDETTNTGDAQINPNGASDPIAITTNLRGNSSKYMFEIQSDRPCVIIAITHYDVPRIHMSSMDRSFLHVDRFDYFNPFMQYTGDQAIYLQELGIQGYTVNALQNFGYTLRHMEYKQLFNSAAGGFKEFLPGFCFPALDMRGSNMNLTPEFIRCVQSEFDSFYTSLTGHSLASYFHFIVDNYVDCSGSRPMAFAPQILG